MSQMPHNGLLMGRLRSKRRGGASDCLLIPATTYPGPCNSDFLVMCEVQTGSHEVHPSNTRAAAAAAASDE